MKKAIFGITLLLAVGLVFFVWPRFSNPQKALGQDAQLYVYTANSIATGAVSLSLPFIKESSRAQVINAALDIDSNGRYSEDEWLVQNQPARAWPDYRNNFTFSAQGLTAGKVYKASVLVSQKSLTLFSEFQASKTSEFELAAQNYELPVSWYKDDSGEVWFGGPGPGFSAFSGAVTNLVAVAQAKGPLDVFVPNMPDLPQGPNECGPVSVANGITHLADKNGQLDNFTAGLNDDIFQAIEELKADMQHDPAKGVRPGNLVPGKEAFVARHNLPIVTETISFPTIEKISELLKSGAAVEVGMSLGGAGHIVTAVGVATAADGTTQLQVHDGATAAGMEGLNLTPPVQVQTPDGRTANAQGIHYPHWQGGPQFINWIIVERWVTSESSQQSSSAQVEEQSQVAVSTGPYTEADKPSQVEMLVLGPNEYYPKFQFTLANPDACKSQHWHKRSTAYGIKIDASDPRKFVPVTRTDLASNGCGFGKVGEVPEESKWITWDMSVELTKNLVTDEASSSSQIEVKGLEGLKTR